MLHSTLWQAALTQLLCLHRGCSMVREDDLKSVVTILVCFFSWCFNSWWGVKMRDCTTCFLKPWIWISYWLGGHWSWGCRHWPFGQSLDLQIHPHCCGFTKDEKDVQRQWKNHAQVSDVHNDLELPHPATKVEIKLCIGGLWCLFAGWWASKQGQVARGQWHTWLWWSKCSYYYPILYPTWGEECLSLGVSQWGRPYCGIFIQLTTLFHRIFATRSNRT